MKNSLAIRKAICACLILVLLLGLCACGASKYESSATAPAATPAPNGSYKPSGGFAYDAETSEIFYDDMDIPMATAEAPAYSFGGYGGDNGYSYPTVDTGAPSLPDNVKLIYTANISLESTEFDRAAEGLRVLVANMGGYFENSSLNNYNSRYRSAYYTVRVPAENFDAFCDSVGTFCQVTNIVRSAQDVSEAYYDTESRLETQRTKLARLQELLSKAENMEDIISLEYAISDTELNIENLTGTLRRYDSLVGYSTIDISLSEVYKLSEIEEPPIGFGARMAAAFRSGCTGFVNGIQRMLLSIARGWIGWLMVIAIVVVVIIIVHRSREKHKANRALRQAENTDGNDE